MREPVTFVRGGTGVLGGAFSKMFRNSSSVLSASSVPSLNHLPITMVFSPLFEQLLAQDF